MIMIGANQYELTWNHFEAIHADKKIAFENLCRSLFKRELCQEGIFLHSNPNHPGVEVEPVIAKDGRTKISFQAKHFDKNIGYAKIEESVNKIVENYAGILDIVYLYCNQDIKTESNSYQRIEKILAGVGISLVLITGQTILDQAMNYPPILSCYFGLDNLDDKWFQNNMELSLKNLGRRYNALFNIDTEAQKKLSLFLHETAGIAEINAKKEALMNELENLRWRCDEKYRTEIISFVKWAESLEYVNVKNFSQAIEWKSRFENECAEQFAKLKNSLTTIQEELKKYSGTDAEYKKLRTEEYEIERILSSSSYLEITKTEISMINCKVAIITGKMGTGKSQLLATAAKRMVEDGRPTLLLLGQTFISDESIENQIIQNLEGLSFGQNFESLISVMDEKAQIIGEDAIIFIDAINESRNRTIWINGINRIIITLEQYSHVKLVISLRTGFEKLTLSQNVLDKKKSGDIAIIRHTGFTDESPERIYEFLSECGISFSPEYYLHSEMTNPLFLTWFCNTYSGEEQGLLALIDSVLKQADREGSKEAGIFESTGMLKSLIYEMLDAAETGVLTKQELLGLTAWNIYGVVNKIGYLNAIERAGVLTSFVQNQEENYYIGYNLLEDYLRAYRIVEREKSKEKIIEYCEKNLLAIEEGSIKNYGNESVFAMVASLYALKYEGELIELIDKVEDEWDKKRLIDNYYSSFIWRSSNITYDGFIEIIKKYPVDCRKVWSVFIENSVKEKSELNALGLTKLLNQYPLNRRDYLWTMVVNEFDESNRMISLAYYIEAGNMLEGLSEHKAYLLLMTYAWMLSSSNRSLRDRVSKAMIEILKEHFSVCILLLKLFKDVNDPYIIQRLYGIVFGAVMRRKKENKSEFGDLAEWVYKEIFDKEIVYPDILLRDYARLIIERFNSEYPDDVGNILLEKIRPPYKSNPIPIVEEVDYGAEEFRESGLWPLLFSMKFDMKVKGVGLYGDFGRYVFQSALEHFVNVDMANIYYYAIQYILNNLEYNPEYFAEYDKHRNNYDRHHAKRVERIGKKYQWITMYNILARVSDIHNIKSWDWKDKIGVVYEGPWNPYVRDFDPTLNIKIKVKNGMPQIMMPKYGKEKFCGINALETDIKKWIMEEDQMFQDFPERFIHKDGFGKEWVSLYIYQENIFRPRGEECPAFGFSKGEQHVWTIATMYILPETKKIYNEQELIESGFVRKNSNGMYSCYSLFSREYAWSAGYNAEFRACESEMAERDMKAFPAAINVLWEEEYDASQGEPTSFAIPTGQIIQEMELYEKEMDGIYYKDEEIAALDLSLLGNEYTEVVIRRDIMNEYMKKTGVQVFWTVIGEKQYFLGDVSQQWKRREGYFVYNNNKIVGSIRVANDN